MSRVDITSAAIGHQVHLEFDGTGAAAAKIALDVWRESLIQAAAAQTLPPPLATSGWRYPGADVDITDDRLAGA